MVKFDETHVTAAPQAKRTKLIGGGSMGRVPGTRSPRRMLETLAHVRSVEYGEVKLCVHAATLRAGAPSSCNASYRLVDSGGGAAGDKSCI